MIKGLENPSYDERLQGGTVQAGEGLGEVLPKYLMGE